MNEGIRKFRELLLTDEEFQQKLKAAGEAYTGEQTEEAVFNNVLLPLGKEYGLSATFEDYKAFISQMSDQEMNREELMQVAGGTKGAGITGCLGIGLGIGGTSGDEVPNVCVVVGMGTTSACAGDGVETGDLDL